MARPAFQAAGAGVHGVGTVSPAWPTHVTDDVALLFVESNDETVTLSDAQGFTEVAGSPIKQPADGAANATRLTVFWCRATSAAMASPTVADSGDHQVARIATFRGVRASGTPIDQDGLRGAINASATTAPTIPGVNTTEPHCLIVVCGFQTIDTSSTVRFGSWASSLSQITYTECFDYSETSGTGGGIGAAAGDFPEMGYCGTSTVAYAGAVWGGVGCLALLPADTAIDEVAPAVNLGHELDGNTLGLWRFNEKLAGFDGSFANNLVNAAIYQLGVGSGGYPSIVEGPVEGRYARRFPGDVASGSSGTERQNFQSTATQALRDALRDGDWTFEAYVRATRVPSGIGAIFSFGNNGATDGTAGNNVVMSVGLTVGYKLRCYWEYSTGSDENVTQVAGSGIGDGLWHHIAVTRDISAKTVEFWVDGALQDTVVYTNDPTDGPTSGTVILVGMAGNGNNEDAEAVDLCDVRISSVVRSGAEIDADYDLMATTCDHALDASTLVLWRLDEAPSARDDGPLGLHACDMLGSNTTHNRSWPTMSGGLISDGGRGRLCNGAALWIGYDDTIRDALLDDFTWEGWVTLHGASTATGTAGRWAMWNSGLATAGTAQRNNGFAFEVMTMSESRYLRALVEHGSGSSAGSAPTSVESIEVGVPVHLAFRKTMTGATWTADFFVNGVNVYTEAGLTNYDGGDDVRYGYYLGQNSNGSPIYGVFDDVRISDIARSDAEILESYRRGAGGIDPVIGAPTPAEGAIDQGDAVEFDVTDADGGLVTTSVRIVATYGADNPTGAAYTEAVYEGGAFKGAFLGVSARASITDGYTFTVDRGGWPSATVTIDVYVVDATGNEDSDSFAYTTDYSPASPAIVFDPLTGEALPDGDPIVVDVTDADADLARITVWAVRDDGVTELVHDGLTSGFAAAFSGSTNGAITNGRRLTVDPGASWRTDAFDLVVKAIDGGGRTTTATASYTTDYATPAGDIVAPTITLISPLSAEVYASTAIVVDVEDEAELSLVAVNVRFPDGTIEVVHDGVRFGHRYRGATNEREILDAGLRYRFTIARDGGWPARPTLSFLVRDMGGNVAVIS
jgi:hypothetical protein